MPSLSTSVSIIHGVTFVLMYIFVTTIAGALSAWVTKKVGDDTAADLGFITLNPLHHIDFLGLLAFVALGIGWGKHVPVNHFNIIGKARTVRVMIAYYADFFARFLLAISLLLSTLFIFGPRAVLVALSILSYPSSFSHLVLSHALPDLSSLHILILYFMITGMYVALLFGTFSFLYNTFYMIFFVASPHARASLTEQSEGYNITVLIVTVIAILLLINSCYTLVFLGLQKVIFVIARLLGYF